MENRQFEAMLAVAQERLTQHAPEDIAGKAGTQYADGSFSLKTLGQTVTVRLLDCTIQPPLSKWHALTLLHYLDLADGAPLTGRTITFSQYKDGLVRGGGLDRNAELIVRRDLGILPPEELERRCRSLGAELLPSNADFCARFDFAPRYPIWLKVWCSDEEFPASARLLLDRFEELNGAQRTTILMVTHDAFTASYCRRILFIKDGRPFTELVRGTRGRKDFFARIIEVVTLLGGDSGDVL